ncbi:MAG: RluA family pseudouridine synthase, partial [Treponema sp.]|nr:RluA family pseudouridine synthase [Treponema sp.]
MTETFFLKAQKKNILLGIWKVPFFSAKVPDYFCGTERLDKYISSLPNAFNRSKLKSGVHEILINSQKAKLSSKVRAGDQIDIQWEDNIPDNIEPEDIPLKIIFENDDVTVVNKEQGVVTHPAAGNWSGTLVNALLHHWGREAVSQIKEGEAAEILSRRRPGIVHRLDKDTSGIIITAKNRDSEEWLQKQFQGRKLRKEYILIVRGCPPKKNGVVDTYLVRDPG